jgi:hypothetical protein
LNVKGWLRGFCIFGGGGQFYLLLSVLACFYLLYANL